MRAVLTNNIRPRIGHPQTVLSHGSSTPIRRTAIPSLRRKLTLCDAFAILLAPVLTTAFVADIISKDKRLQAWDQKIANVQKEIEALKEREAQSWQNRQLLSVQAGLKHQRRSYSTASAVNPSQIDSEVKYENLDYNDNEVSSSRAQSIAFERLADLQRYENSLATKVGLQMLLYILTGRDPSGGRMDPEYAQEVSLVPNNMESLLDHLRRVDRDLQELKQTVADYTADLSMDTPERRELDTRISDLTWQCRTGDISVTDLIYRYTQAVMESRTGLSLSTYQNVVETFSTLNADALTFIAMFPYLKTRQILSDRNVANIIYQYGALRDPHKLESFLRKLCQPRGGFRIASEWELVSVNGIRVSAPLNRRPRLLDVLIRAALQGDQPHKARAWATLLMQQGISTIRLAHLFNSFLTYCARHVDWAYGQLWLHRTITWAALFGQDSPSMLSKLIFRILDLCVACDQPQLYDSVLDAAVFAGIDVPSTDETRPDNFAEIAVEIRSDWTYRMKNCRELPRSLEETLEAAIDFQSEMAKVNISIQDFIGITDIAKLRDMIASNVSPTAGRHERDRPADPAPLYEFQPRTEVSHLDHPQRLLSMTSDQPELIVFEPFSKQHVEHSPDSMLKPSASIDTESDMPQSELRKHLTRLQDSYGKLNERYTRQLEINDEMRKALDTGTSPHEAIETSHDLKELARKLYEYQEQSAQFEDHNSDLKKEIRALEARNEELSATVAQGKQNEVQLSELINQLELQLNTTKPKSLEAVFVEKENFNLRFEMKELSSRYLSALAEKEEMEEKVNTLQEQIIEIRDMSSTEIDRLRRENALLQEQVQSATNRNEKLTLASKARESNLQKILNISEDRVKTLRSKLSTTKSNSQQTSAVSQMEEGIENNERSSDVISYQGT